MRRSIPRLDEQQKKQAVAALESHENASRDESSATHRAFHLSLYAAAGARLARLIGQHIDAAERYLRLEATLVGTVDKDRQEHRALLDAALTGDVESAHQLIEQHVAGSGLRIATLLRERGGTREKE